MFPRCGLWSAPTVLERKRLGEYLMVAYARSCDVSSNLNPLVVSYSSLLLKPALPPLSDCASRSAAEECRRALNAHKREIRGYPGALRDSSGSYSLSGPDRRLLESHRRHVSALHTSQCRTTVCIIRVSAARSRGPWTGRDWLCDIEGSSTRPSRRGGQGVGCLSLPPPRSTRENSGEWAMS